MAHWMKLCFWELGFATTLAKEKAGPSKMFHFCHSEQFTVNLGTSWRCFLKLQKSQIKYLTEDM